MALGLLLVLFMVMSFISVMGLVLLFLLKGEKGQKAVFYFMAVVSTAMSRGNFLQMRSNPFILWIGLLGFTIQAPVTLAQSMAEPPPKAMIAFVPLSRYSVLASSILVMVGLTLK